MLSAPEEREDDKSSALIVSNSSINKKYSINSGSIDDNEHDQVLQFSLLQCRKWILLSIILTLTYSIRWYIWILYAHELGEYNHIILSILLYTIFIFSGISALFWSWLGDKYTFDEIGLFVIISQFVGLLLESTTSSSYIQLFIGTIFWSLFQGTSSIPLAYIAKYLPQKWSVQLTSTLYGVVTLTYLLGPIISGIFATYINYRSCFIVASSLCYLSILFYIFKINGKEKQIISRQNAIKHLYNNKNCNIEKDEQFPLIMNKTRDDNDDKIYSMLSVIMLANAMTFGQEAIEATYYVLFVTEVLNDKIIIATLQTAVNCFFFIISSVITPKILERFNVNNANNVTIFEYLFMIFWDIAMIFMYYAWSLLYEIKWYYWIFVIGVGFGMGFVNMTQEAVLLKLQPKKHSGKISGIKVLIRNLIKAIIILVLTILYEKNKRWYLYIQSIIYMINLGLTIIMAFIQEVIACCKC